MDVTLPFYFDYIQGTFKARDEAVGGAGGAEDNFAGSVTSWSDSCRSGVNVNQGYVLFGTPDAILTTTNSDPQGAGFDKTYSISGAVARTNVLRWQVSQEGEAHEDVTVYDAVFTLTRAP